MTRKPVAISILVLGVSITLLISGGIAVWNAGVIADEKNLTDNFHPSLWFIFGAGLIGLLISLPWFLGTFTASHGPKKAR